MPEIDKGSMRLLKEEDLGLVLEWRNSERIRNSMISNHIISWEEHLSWFKNLKESDTYLIFEYMGQPAGMVNFTEINIPQGTGWWGFYVGKAGLPRGTGLLMGYLGLTYVFENLKSNMVLSKVLAANQVSLAYHKRLGFSEDVMEKQYIFRDGENQEIVYFSYEFEKWVEYKPVLEQACIDLNK